MNTKSNKQQYNSPQIERIGLDNEIALILASGNPGDPHSESNKAVPEFFNQHPIMDAVG